MSENNVSVGIFRIMPLNEEASGFGRGCGKRIRKPLQERSNFFKRRECSRRLEAQEAGRATADEESELGGADNPNVPAVVNMQSSNELDDNLMALLLPEAVAPSVSSGNQAYDAVMPPSGDLKGSPRSDARVEPAPTTIQPQGAATDLLPVAAAVAAAGLPEVRVQNVIASGLVVVEGRRSATLDLRRIAVSCRFAEYNPRKINACIVRLRKPKCTGLIFRSGECFIHI